MRRYAIVGCGVAGITAAQTLRRSDPAAAITLLGDEPHPYYFRPKLWEFLAGQAEPSALYYRPLDWATAQKIDHRMNAAVDRIQPAEHSVALASGEAIAYDRLLLATGSRGCIPDVPGTGLAGVFVLRTLADAAALRAKAAGSRRAVVVGGGLLGLEAARALSLLHLDVTVAEIVPHLLPRQMDAEGARFLQANLESQGLTILTGVRTIAVEGESSAAGIRLEDGRRIPADIVLFSAGVLPRIELARAAGLAANRGIAADARLQTSAPDVFAAGDAAEIDGRTYGLIPPAIEQARAAARNMSGAGTVEYRGTLPAAGLKLLGMDLTSLGEATAEDPALTVRRFFHEADCVYKKIVLRDGVVVGAILLNDAASVAPIRQLISSGRRVADGQDRLLDPAFNLKEFVSKSLSDPAPATGGSAAASAADNLRRA
jgi:nitrite reductase (NADH) large subunit